MVPCGASMPDTTTPPHTHTQFCVHLDNASGAAILGPAQTSPQTVQGKLGRGLSVEPQKFAVERQAILEEVVL